MIPAKLYIPTSSQNFNSIMSSESISPAAFYERRNFGMRRFLRVEPNNLNDRIALYDCIPLFTIPMSDEDNFPIFIEVQTACYDEDMFYASELDGVYYCDKTVYLSPYHCRFFFLSEGDYRTVYSSQQRSLNTKMTRLYGKAFFRVSANLPQKRYDYSTLSDSGKDFSQHIAYDRRVNKLKGFYLSYLIGKMKDLSPSFVHLYHLTNQISDTLASSLTSSFSTISQTVQIDYLYDELNKGLRAISKEDECIAEAVKKETEKYGIMGDLLVFLRDHLWLGDWKRQMNIPETYQVTPFHVPIAGSMSEQDAKDLYIENIYSHLNALRGSVYPSSNELPSISQQCVSSVPEEGFWAFALNEMLQEVYNGKDFMDDRYQFSLSICKQYKGAVSEESFAVVRQYLNALNKNLNNHEAFEVNGIEDTDLQAYATFCQKGDPDDFGKLEDYMIKSELGCLHKGVALAGMLFGYADLPKTFTKEFTYAKDQLFIRACYRYMTQISGINIADMKEEDVEIVDKNLSAPTNPKLKDEVHKVVAPLNPSTQTIQKINEAIEVESRQYDPQAFLEILNNLVSTKSAMYKALKEHFAKSNRTYTTYAEFRNDIRSVYECQSKASKKTVDWSVVETTLELEAKISDPFAFMSILDDHLSPSDEAYKALAKHFGTGITAQTKTKQPQQQDLFSQSEVSIAAKPTQPSISHSSSPTNAQMVYDSNLYYVIEHLLPEDRDVRAQVKTDVKWFYDNHQAGFIATDGKSACWANSSKDNASAIKRFSSFAANRLKLKQAWVVERWKKVDVSTIIAYLKTVYK